MNYKTKVRESPNGYTVEFSIGVQTFSLKEIEEDTPEDSEIVAKWYEERLKYALDKLKDSKKFTVQPLIGSKSQYVVYRDSGKEILVRVTGKHLLCKDAKLTEAEKKYFKDNIL